MCLYELLLLQGGCAVLPQPHPEEAVVDICLGITEKLVHQILVGRKLVDFYLTNIPAAVRLNTAYCLLD